MCLIAFPHYIIFFSEEILSLCHPEAVFQYTTMPATGQKVCGSVVWWWLKPILVFSLVQADQYKSTIFNVRIVRGHTAITTWEEWLQNKHVGRISQHSEEWTDM